MASRNHWYLRIPVVHICSFQGYFTGPAPAMPPSGPRPNFPLTVLVGMRVARIGHCHGVQKRRRTAVK